MATGPEARSAEAAGKQIITDAEVSFGPKPNIVKAGPFTFFAGLRSDAFFVDFEGILKLFDHEGGRNFTSHPNLEDKSPWTGAVLGFAPEFVPVPAPEAAPRARLAALEALRLDPGLAQAHTWLGVVRFLYDWDWAAAEAEFRRAIQLDRGYALSETWYAFLLGPTGRPEESLRRILHAEAIEPLSLQIRQTVGRCCYVARCYEQAHQALTAILKDEPGHPHTTSWLARALCAMGRQDEALEILQRFPQQTPMSDP